MANSNELVGSSVTVVNDQNKIDEPMSPKFHVDMKVSLIFKLLSMNFLILNIRYLFIVLNLRNFK